MEKKNDKKKKKKKTKNEMRACSVEEVHRISRRMLQEDKKYCIETLAEKLVYGEELDFTTALGLAKDIMSLRYDFLKQKIYKSERMEKMKVPKDEALLNIYEYQMMDRPITDRDNLTPKEMQDIYKLRFKPIEEELRNVIKLGISLQELSIFMNISTSVLKRFAREVPEFYRLINVAKLEAVGELSSAMYKNAVGITKRRNEYQLDPEIGEMVLVRQIEEELPPDFKSAEYLMNKINTGNNKSTSESSKNIVINFSGINRPTKEEVDRERFNHFNDTDNNQALNQLIETEVEPNAEQSEDVASTNKENRRSRRTENSEAKKIASAKVKLIRGK